MFDSLDAAIESEVDQIYGLSPWECKDEHGKRQPDEGIVVANRAGQVTVERMPVSSKSASGGRCSSAGGSMSS
ncbi:MAG: hypothetical protein H6839_09800 [Planctomycetes bacterium]|nr:hypothetical protein [Planctomycetota bacterium]